MSLLLSLLLENARERVACSSSERFLEGGEMGGGEQKTLLLVAITSNDRS